MLILGVTGGFGHDASAALVKDGEVVGMVEEERLSRIKGAIDAPATRSILALTQSAGVELRDIDVLALSWDPAKDASNDRMRLAEQRLKSSRLLSDLRGAELRHFAHHECHAAAGYLFSGLDVPAFGLVIDGRGEVSSTTVFSITPDLEFSPLAQSSLPASLGTFYAAATDFCGFGDGGQGKTMALAGFGSPVYDFPELAVDDLFITCSMTDAFDGDLTATHRRVRPRWVERFAELFGPARAIGNRWHDVFGLEPDSHYNSRHADAAASAQAALTRVVVDLVSQIKAIDPARPIVFAGGVALNCSLNGTLRAAIPDTDLQLSPVPHDAGAALGAAAIASAEMGVMPRGPLSPYLGLNWSDSAVGDILRNSGVSFMESEDVPGLVAERILDGQVFGWFQGPAEVGPRALGHRSIVASPFDISVAERINARIKGRESWRPFGPSVQRRDMYRLFGRMDAPYMMEAFPVAPCVSRDLRAVVHLRDSTSRPHSVAIQAASPRYDALLQRVRNDSGYGVVLNTSFNIGREPIVYTPLDALRTYIASSLDGLAIGPYLMMKR